MVFRDSRECNFLETKSLKSLEKPLTNGPPNSENKSEKVLEEAKVSEELSVKKKRLCFVVSIRIGNHKGVSFLSHPNFTQPQGNHG